MIRVVLPYHLQTLAKVGREVTVEVPEPVTQRSLLDGIEARYPALRGAIRDPVTQHRRALVRFFACGEDLSNAPADAALPPAAMIVGAIAGG